MFNNHGEYTNVKNNKNICKAFERCNLDNILQDDKIDIYLLYLENPGIYNVRELIPNLKQHVNIYWPRGQYFKLHIEDDTFVIGKHLLGGISSSKNIEIEIELPTDSKYIPQIRKMPFWAVILTGDIFNNSEIKISEFSNNSKRIFGSQKYYQNHVHHFLKVHHPSYTSLYEGRLRYKNKNNYKTLVYYCENQDTPDLLCSKEYSSIANLVNIEQNFDGNIIVLRPVEKDLACSGLLGLPSISKNLYETASFLKQFIKEKLPETKKIFFHSFCNGSYGTTILARLFDNAVSFTSPIQCDIKHYHFYEVLRKNVDFKLDNFLDFLYSNKSNTKSYIALSSLVNLEMYAFKKFIETINKDQRFDALENIDIHLLPNPSGYSTADNFINNTASIGITNTFK
ncbi:uncharacterized protein METZ01_LOCUS149326 [marine metagenome]|uniref:Uncharacterized protein n=1 Tax=marine metagenome TaxID=408172 RepID=A0A382A5T0_9ZZZZ